MKTSKIITYIIYLFVLFGFLSIGSWANVMLIILSKTHNKSILGFIGSMAICILLGLVMGIEHFVTEYRKQGKWIVNITKLIIIGIPSLILTFYLALYFIIPIPLPMHGVIYNDKLFSEVSGLIFGYTLLTSLGKKQENPVPESEKNKSMSVSQ